MGSGPEVVVSRTYTSNPHNPILTPPIRIIFVTTTMRSTLISACLIGWASASCSVSSPEPKAKASDDKNYMAECITALEGQIVIERSHKQGLLWHESNRADREDLHLERGGRGVDHGPQDGEGGHRQDEGHDRHLLHRWQRRSPRC